MNQNCKLFVFDLDGTLVESAETIYIATVAAFKELGIKTAFDKAAFMRMIGMHFEDMFRDLHITVDDFDEFITIYKRHYNQHLDTSILYPGVMGALKALTVAGRQVALLTTKGQEQADYIIDHFGLRAHFDYVMGRRPDLEHKPSPEPLLYICRSLDITPEETVIIGDTELDILCGKNAGAATCAVTYGYRKRSQLEEVQPDIIVDNLSEALSYFWL